MASLYIKNAEAAELAERLARMEGTTKTRAVLDALKERIARRDPEPSKRDYTAWVEWFRRTNPLPAPTGLKADKAFFDSLYEDESE